MQTIDARKHRKNIVAIFKRELQTLISNLQYNSNTNPSWPNEDSKTEIFLQQQQLK